ncbi:MAG TPA: M28 family peptidase, partial [Gemmatimonadaceae bacterium]|nr:M28 family peptidase [Gemmatimonadaceae bacterium]
DGRWVSYETGTGNARVTRIASAAADAGFAVHAELTALDVALSPSSGRVAWIAPAGETSQLRVGELPARAPRTPALAGRVLDLGSLQAAQVRFADDSTLLVVAATAGDVRTALYRVTRSPRGQWAAPERVSRTDSVVSDPVIAGTGTTVLVGVGGRSPLQRGTGGAFARGPARRQYALLDLQSGRESRIDGEAAVLSARGTHVAWLTREGGRQRVHVAPTSDVSAARVVHTTTDALDALALSPDGARVTFQERPREDWELFTVHVADGRRERVTREIQHDLLPQWLDDDRLLAVMGEARHRRAHLYVNGERRRVFHNNTVRTIAPEYEWVPSPDGTKLLVVAERDGDTVTPHRHLWCVDLSREVTVTELRARLADNLQQEQRLRADGERRFAPIADAVRAAVADVNVDRVYRYGFDLFQFDSKHLTQPGNAKARDYLLSTYRGFGYRDVHEQRFDARTGVDRPTVPTANIVAVLPGTTHPELVYVISSHFDSRAEGPGADDNTSGTQALLETARVLASRPQAATIIFASLSGEESGLLGGREFVRVAKANGLRLMGVLNNDMVGWANDQRLDNTIRYSNPGIRDIQHAAAIGFTDLITYDAFYYKSTDAQAFYDGYGDIVGGIGSYPVLGNPHYHQPHDVLETINHRLVAEVAKTTVASIMYLASAPSRLTGLTLTTASGGAAQAQWTASPERDVVRYVVTWGPAEAPTRHRAETASPSLLLRDAPVGTVVQVKAVNAKGLEGWDWARGVVR